MTTANERRLQEIDERIEQLDKRIRRLENPLEFGLPTKRHVPTPSAEYVGYARKPH